MRLHGGQALGVTRDLSSWFNPGLASRLPLLLPVFHSVVSTSGHTLGGRVRGTRRVFLALCDSQLLSARSKTMSRVAQGRHQNTHFH